MAIKVIKDPTHPDFPHGTARGYYRGCTGEVCGGTCRRAHLDRRREREEATKPVLPASRVDATPAREHLQLLLQDEDWGTVANIAAASGVDDGTLQNILRGQPRVQHLTAQSILAVDVAWLRRAAWMFPVRIPIQRVRSLQAQGWPLRWQATRLGQPSAKVPSFLFDRDRWVTRPVFERVEALYEEIGFRRGPSARAAKAAAQAGWYPSGCYDDDGRLIPGAARVDEKAEERKAAQDRAARARLTAVRESLNLVQVEVVAERTGLTVSSMRKYLFPEVGIAFTVAVRNGPDVTLDLRADCRDRAAWLRAQLAQFDIDPEADPVETAWRIGVRTGLRLNEAERAELAAKFPAGDEHGLAA